MKAIIFSIGDELISGSSVDTNSAWLADRLTLSGIDVTCHITLGDNADQFASALVQASVAADWVMISGGLGPTEDDRTRAALARAMGVPLEFDSESWVQIQAFFTRLSRTVSPSNRVQALRPQGSRAIPNLWGTAPGIDARLNRGRVFVMPGVPREMKGMFERSVEPEILRATGTQAKVRVELHCIGISEAQIGEQIKSFMAFGRNPMVGTRAADGIITLRITAKAASLAEAEVLAEFEAQALTALLGPACFGRGSDTLASVVGELLRGQKKSVATAESCTGGLLGAAFTAVAGSSDYFLGGYLTYSNRMKVEMLNVSEASLQAHGAVSEAVAKEMADGVRRKVGSDYALSITGVAGPGGGTAEKPVGMVCIGLSDSENTAARTLLIPQELGREGIRTRSVQTALDMLRRRLLGQ